MVPFCPSNRLPFAGMKTHTEPKQIRPIGLILPILPFVQLSPTQSNLVRPNSPRHFFAAGKEMVKFRVWTVRPLAVANAAMVGNP